MMQNNHAVVLTRITSTNSVFFKRTTFILAYKRRYYCYFYSKS